jgi:hypothetical protein
MEVSPDSFFFFFSLFSSFALPTPIVVFPLQLGYWQSAGGCVATSSALCTSLHHGLSSPWCLARITDCCCRTSRALLIDSSLPCQLPFPCTAPSSWPPFSARLGLHLVAACLSLPHESTTLRCADACPVKGDSKGRLSVLCLSCVCPVSVLCLSSALSDIPCTITQRHGEPLHSTAAFSHHRCRLPPCPT